jgi:hypothetical protein
LLAAALMAEFAVCDNSAAETYAFGFWATAFVTSSLTDRITPLTAEGEPSIMTMPLVTPLSMMIKPLLTSILFPLFVDA